MIKTCFIFVLWAVVVPAYAHHPLEGQPVETFTHGALSGIGHPVLGLDHLFFVVLVGTISAFSGYPFRAPLAYIAAMLVGCFTASQWGVLPVTEPVIVASLLLLGVIVVGAFRLGMPVTIGLFSLFGLFHGSAFGGFMAAQEAGFGVAVLVGYLLGLGVTQYGLALAVGWVFRRVSQNKTPAAIPARSMGALSVMAGLLLAFEIGGVF